jgi:4-hydroxy-tetrahydrodipicolinate reductase
MTLAISILGAHGKMGQRIIHLAQGDSRYQIINGSICPHDALSVHEEFFQRKAPTEVIEGCQVAIDFSVADAAITHIEAAQKLGKALVIGTTGLDEDSWSAMRSASDSIPIFYSPNFSLGMALCFEAVKKFARSLLEECYIDIVETHHVTKKDSPSGTAYALARATGKEKIVFQSPSFPRTHDELVIHSIRSGKAVGEHTIIFEWGDERIELTHRAQSRDPFARGALIAAEWVFRQPPGLYSMKDLLSNF